MKVMDIFFFFLILRHEETQSAYSAHLLLSHQGELRGRKEKNKQFVTTRICSEADGIRDWIICSWTANKSEQA